MEMVTLRIREDILQNLTEGLLIIDTRGIIRDVNPAAAEILGFSKETMQGTSFSSLLSDYFPKERFRKFVLRMIMEKQKTRTIMLPYTVGETKKHLRFVFTLLMNVAEMLKGVAILISDLSELTDLQDSVRAMEQIGRLNRQLQARNDLLSKTFGMFLSDEIVSELLDAPGGLMPGGKKRNVTVMMSDIRGFTAISEKMDAQELITMLNHYLEKMTEIIQKRRGTIIEFMGDGILAIFGAPVESETHAADAVAAALEMEDAMEEINLWNMERDYPNLETGVGIDSGEVIIGNIGSVKRMKYGALGTHVNMCGRIESYTVGGQILISSDTKEQISVPLEIEKEITVLPKGASEEMVLSHIIGIGEPYGIRIKAGSDQLKELAHPVPVCFYRLDKKHTLQKVYYGGILSLGRNSALLETETNLELFDNLQMDAGGRLLCKVMENDEGKYLLRYTYIPAGYEAWIRKTAGI